MLVPHFIVYIVQNSMWCIRFKLVIIFHFGWLNINICLKFWHKSSVGCFLSRYFLASTFDYHMMTLILLVLYMLAYQIASFIKTHIFSRRRPIDGWKYMIEELGPNAKKGRGSVSRLPSLSDPSTQPFKEEKAPISAAIPSHRGR